MRCALSEAMSKKNPRKQAISPQIEKVIINQVPAEKPVQKVQSPSQEKVPKTVLSSRQIQIAENGKKFSSPSQVIQKTKIPTESITDPAFNNFFTILFSQTALCKKKLPASQKLKEINLEIVRSKREAEQHQKSRLGCLLKEQEQYTSKPQTFESLIQLSKIEAALNGIREESIPSHILELEATKTRLLAEYRSICENEKLFQHTLKTAWDSLLKDTDKLDTFLNEILKLTQLKECLTLATFLKDTKANTCKEIERISAEIQESKLKFKEEQHSRVSFLNKAEQVYRAKPQTKQIVELLQNIQSQCVSILEEPLPQSTAKLVAEKNRIIQFWKAIHDCTVRMNNKIFKIRQRIRKSKAFDKIQEDSNDTAENSKMEIDDPNSSHAVKSEVDEYLDYEIQEYPTNEVYIENRSSLQDTEKENAMQIDENHHIPIKREIDDGNAENQIVIASVSSLQNFVEVKQENLSPPKIKVEKEIDHSESIIQIENSFSLHDSIKSEIQFENEVITENSVNTGTSLNQENGSTVENRPPQKIIRIGNTIIKPLHIADVKSLYTWHNRSSNQNSGIVKTVPGKSIRAMNIETLKNSGSQSAVRPQIQPQHPQKVVNSTKIIPARAQVPSSIGPRFRIVDSFIDGKRTRKLMPIKPSINTNKFAVSTNRPVIRIPANKTNGVILLNGNMKVTSVSEDQLMAKVSVNEVANSAENICDPLAIEIDEGAEAGSSSQQNLVEIGDDVEFVIKEAEEQLASIEEKPKEKKKYIRYYCAFPSCKNAYRTMILMKIHQFRDHKANTKDETPRGNVNYKCNICRKSQKLYRTYVTHMEKQHDCNMNRNDCEKCTECWENKSYNLHVVKCAKKEAKNSQKCKVCSKILSSKKDLQTHTQFVHEWTLGEIETLGCVEYRCMYNDCALKFETKKLSELKKHFNEYHEKINGPESVKYQKFCCIYKDCEKRFTRVSTRKLCMEHILNTHGTDWKMICQCKFCKQFMYDPREYISHKCGY